MFSTSSSITYHLLCMRNQLQSGLSLDLHIGVNEPLGLVMGPPLDREKYSQYDAKYFTIGWHQEF